MVLKTLEKHLLPILSLIIIWSPFSRFETGAGFFFVSFIGGMILASHYNMGAIFLACVVIIISLMIYSDYKIF